MDKNFWRKKWKESDIAFNQDEVNSLLTRHFKEIFPANIDRIFLPLCGKTLDAHWLRDNGYHVVGAELSEMAVDQLFDELSLDPQKTACGDVCRYSAKDIDIFVGDIFDLSGEMLGKIDAIYDRAAMVALPEEIRNQYTAHMIEITNKAPQFLICYEYDQSLMEGPPFSIMGDELNRRYASVYNVTLIESRNAPGGLKGNYEAKEKAWLLRNERRANP